MNDLVPQLNKLRAIQPDQDFSVRSKSVILALHPHPNTARFRMPFALFWVGAMAAVLLVAVFVFPATRGGITVSALNPERISQELNSLDISVELQAIRYRQVSNQEIASAINEIGDTRTRHLNPDLLQSELDTLEPGQELLLLLYCEPQPLYAILKRNGYSYSNELREDGTNAIRISKA